MNKQKAFLIILDGWGIGPDPNRSAIAMAETPFYDNLLKNYPHATLTTYGQQVGLPEGQMGNSEVGHLNIGAGRIVYQELARINKSIKDGAFSQNEVIKQLVAEAKTKKKKVHLLGLLSDGGVHAHINHIKAVAKLLDNEGIVSYIHAFMDGRDTAPKSGVSYMAELEEAISGSSVEVASVVGRYYAMDRDQRWERVKKAYDLLVHGHGKKSKSAVQAIEESYKSGITDEFIEPICIVDDLGKANGLIDDGDIVFFVNFRTDRPRQLTEVLSQKDRLSEGMKRLDLSYYTMTSYDESFQNIKVVFKKDKLKNTIGEVIASHALTQVRIAETEKYPHVTFFFNGGLEDEFEGEKRILIPSPKVATYDLKPEMSALEISEAIQNEIKANNPNFICLNFANTDMVGHTGDIEAAKISAETVDGCLSEIIPLSLDHQYQIMIIADHGNSDYMINDDGSPHTAHTINPVPIIYVAEGAHMKKVKEGKLADISPTILSLLGIDRPKEMTGEIIIE